MKTRYKIPISVLPEELLVEELRYCKVTDLESWIENRPKKDPESSITILYEWDTKEELLQLAAHASEQVLKKALELSRAEGVNEGD